MRVLYLLLGFMCLLSAKADSCTKQADSETDPIFYVICPSGCQAKSDRLWGTDAYTADSYICAAAIHAGVITSSGGTVKVYKSPGRDSYSGNTQYGITSKAYGKWKASFQFADPTISCAKQADSVTDSIFYVICPSGCQDTSDRVWGTDAYTADSYICAAAIHAGVITNSGGSVKAYKSTGRDAYSGSTQNEVISKDYGKWTSSFQFTNPTISCRKQADSVTDSIFYVICPPGCEDTNDRVWGTDVYTADSYICAAAIHSGLITSSGGSLKVYKSPGRDSYSGSIQYGITSKAYGKWKASFQFTDPLISCTKQGDSETDSIFYVICPSGCQDTSDKVWGTDVYTADSYICASAIHAGVVTNSGGSVKAYKSPGRDAYSGSTQNEIISKDYGKWTSSFQFTNPTISCRKQADSVTDSIFYVICPPGCEDTNDRVWGTDVYTADSYICAAAIHSGVITSSGGSLKVYKSPGRDSYSESIQYGITSKAYGKWKASFQFANPLISCTKQADSETDSIFYVICPSGCQATSDRVWGTDAYTADSYICAAAIHSGVVTSSGGSVKVYKSSGRDSYFGSFQYGITSKAYGKWKASFQFADPTISCRKQADSETDSIFYVICPPGCQTTNDRVWGTNVYTADSYICAAAIHSGLITNSGGSVKVYKSPGKNSYSGSTQHGITSKNYGKWSSSFQFTQQ